MVKLPSVWGAAALSFFIWGMAIFWPLNCGAAAGTSSTPPGITKSEEFVIDSWQSEDGLPQNSVTSIAQTPDGYLWLATFNGLVRFDGVAFRVFDADNTPELPSSRIVQVVCDALGRLWIVSEFQDLTLYEGKRFSQLPLASRNQTNNASRLKATSLGLTPGGSLYLQGLQTNIFRYEHELTERETHLPDNFGRVVSWTADRDHQIWFSLKRAFGFVDDAGFHILNSHPADTGPEIVSAARGAGVWMAGRATGLQRAVNHQTLSNGIPWPATGLIPSAIFEDKQGRAWVGTWADGIWIRGDDKWIHLSTANGLSHNSVRAIFEDREGNIWIGTDGGGLNRLRKRLFKLLDSSVGLPTDVTLTVTSDTRDDLWVGLNLHGAIRYSSNQVSALNLTEELGQSSSVWSMLGTRDGSVWTSDNHSGLIQFTQNGRMERYPNRNGVRRYIRAILESADGAMWLGHLAGLMHFQKDPEPFFRDIQELDNFDIRCLALTPEGRLFIGTNGEGLLAYQGGKLERIPGFEKKKENRIWSLYLDAEGVLWVGTYGSGIRRFKEGQLLDASAPGGLPAKVVSAIIEDDHGLLWISTLDGLYHVAKAELNRFVEGGVATVTYRHFDRSDGLRSIEFSGGLQPAACKMRDGTLYFPTIKGVASVDPAETQINPIAANAIIESVSMDNISTEVAGQQELLIPAGVERLEIHYTGICFSAPEKVRFKYRLLPFEQTFIEANSRRVAYYSKVPPGDYTFEVLACNNDGVWAPQPAYIRVHWIPYFWQRRGFIWGTIAGTILLLIVVVRFLSVQRMQRRLALLEQQHALQNERARIAQDIHDDLGARLTQVGLLSELARRSATKTDAAEHLVKISTTTREMVQAMDEIVWAIDPEKDKIEDLASYLPSYAQQFLEPSGIKCRFQVPPFLPQLPLSAEARHSIFLVFKEALNNAVKYSGAGKIVIEIALAEKCLTIGILDDGKGFDPVAIAEDGGNGLKNMAVRLAKIGGQVKILSTPGEGTHVLIEVLLPE